MSFVNGQGHDRTALVLYGSETGNAQDVADELGRLTERLRFTTQVSSLDDVDPVCSQTCWQPALGLLEKRFLIEKTIVIIAVSTTGQGDLPLNARTFWRSLLRKKLPPDFLQDVQFTSFGLGDSSYPKYDSFH